MPKKHCFDKMDGMRICYTGGGTLGHVLPALSVHQCLKGVKGYECLFIGSRKPAEKECVEKECVPFAAIASGKLRRYPSPKTIFAAFSIMVGFFQSLFILLRYHPDVLFSKGGYVSVPPVYAAGLLHIPVVTHESDLSPGLANRMNAKVARKICVSAPEAGKGLPPEKVVVTGNPLRRELLVPPAFDMKQKLGTAKPLLLVMGGSQGAHQINVMVRDNLDALCSRFFVYHQCGAKEKEVVTHKDYFCTAFIDEGLNELYRSADVVVSRSGAGAIAEICHFGKASVLVPLSAESSRGDQVANAKRLEEKDAALVVTKESEFLHAVFSLLEDSEKQSRMEKNASALDENDAAEKIAAVILSCMKKE